MSVVCRTIISKHSEQDAKVEVSMQQQIANETIVNDSQIATAIATD